jgi:hypothetical protein
MNTVASKACSIDGCGRPILAWGWCNRHYRRWKRNGDPSDKPRVYPVKSEAPGWFNDVFMASVKIDEATGCWVWQRPISTSRYGAINFAGKRRGAHRVAFAVHNGRNIDGLGCICHRCDNPPCVNPAHLFEATQLENIRDRNEKQRTARGEATPHARLNPEKVLDIRRRAASGKESVRSISRSYGVDHMTILNIVRGETWGHV